MAKPYKIILYNNGKKIKTFFTTNEAVLVKKIKNNFLIVYEKRLIKNDFFSVIII